MEQIFTSSQNRRLERRRDDLSIRKNGERLFILFIETDGEAIVVDPARSVDAYIDFAKERNVTIKHVVDTHLHADHISGGRLLRKRTGAAYYLPPKDAEEVLFSYEPLVEDENISVGSAGMKAEPIYSPGHTIVAPL